MEWGTISAASIIGILFSLIVSIGLPITLGIIVYKKIHAKISACFIGAGIFVVFALILEQIMHAIVLAINPAFQNYMILFGLYAALAAALFEETGRLVAMKFFMKKSLDKGDALMYGVGHGGVEAILLVGLTYVNNLIISIMINTGGIQLAMSQMEPALQEATYQQLQALWQTPAYHFYMAGVERLSAIVLQICLSVLVYKCVKTGQKKFLAGAFLLHFIVDFVTVITAGFGLPIWAVEIEVVVIVVIVVWGVARIYRKD
ncbi:MAG: YhfC family intramembrane metalloprotease [Lachnospiraceae bacterium]|nr:YhfC family intramembrane metalloprotease [Lachnospiraceae bacterium]